MLGFRCIARGAGLGREVMRRMLCEADRVFPGRGVRISATLLSGLALVALALAALAVGKYPVSLADIADLLRHRLLGTPSQAPAATRTPTTPPAPAGGPAPARRSAIPAARRSARARSGANCRCSSSSRSS